MSTRHYRARHRVDRQGTPTLRNWDAPKRTDGKTPTSEVVLDCGWGQLVFAHTFDNNVLLAEAICDEAAQRRNIALYIKDPHVILTLRPQDVFLDPSHTYRLWLHAYLASRVLPKGFIVRRAQDRTDARAIAHLLEKRGMVPSDPDFIASHVSSRTLTHFVAEDEQSGAIIGTVMGVDHKRAFEDVENGSSLWALAVDPQAPQPGVGHTLTATLADHFAARGRHYMDLSVMHSNKAVIRLYEKMGFQRVPVFCVKKKNAINEPLYTGSGESENQLNPYAQIIIDEARRRGIAVELIDATGGYFKLTVGARSIVCRESLSESTSAIAMSRCAEKRTTHRLLSNAGLKVPDHALAGHREEERAFLTKIGRIVVKPENGEQGMGVSVGVTNEDELKFAISEARQFCSTVLLEEFVPGQDLRIVVIDGAVIAAALRRPAEIKGNGRDTVRTLIDKQSRRRAAASGGESRIPVDRETHRCLDNAGVSMNAVLHEDRVVQVRETANLHTGGTLHDVTDKLHPELAHVATLAAQTLEIPVVGLDLIVAGHDKPDYCIVEANERPGLANHEPQPTAERFIDFLFPQTAARGAL